MPYIDKRRKQGNKKSACGGQADYEEEDWFREKVHFTRIFCGFLQIFAAKAQKILNLYQKNLKVAPIGPISAQRQRKVC